MPRLTRRGDRPSRGTYWCQASNEEGKVTSRKASLDIGILRGDFIEEPLDTWVSLKREVSGSWLVNHLTKKKLIFIHTNKYTRIYQHIS